MASATSIFPLLPRSRGRSFFLPREHGAWGMLLVPLVTGAAAGNPRGERIIWILLFAAVALGLFCLRTPVEAWLGISPLRPQNDAERKLIYYSFYIYASVAGSALAVLILWAHAYGLLLLGAVAAMAFLLQAVLKQLGRETRMNAQLTGAIALSSTSAGAYYLATGHFGPTAIIIWLANWLFAANQIHFVQLRIHSARRHDDRGKIPPGKRLPASPSLLPAAPGIDLASRMASRSHPDGIRASIRPRVRVVSRITPATPGPPAGAQRVALCHRLRNVFHRRLSPPDWVAITSLCAKMPARTTPSFSQESPLGRGADVSPFQ